MNYYYNLPLELQNYIESFLLIKPNEIIYNTDVLKTTDEVELVKFAINNKLYDATHGISCILRINEYQKHSLNSYDYALYKICNIIYCNHVLYNKYKNCVELPHNIIKFKQEQKKLHEEEQERHKERMRQEELRQERIRKDEIRKQELNNYFLICDWVRQEREKEDAKRKQKKIRQARAIREQERPIREQEKAIRDEELRQDILNNNHLYSFKVGYYEFNANKNLNYGSYKIRVLKKTKKMLHLHIEYYNGYLDNLNDVEIKRKICKDEYGAEYLNTIWFNWNTPQEKSWRCDYFNISAKDLNSNEVIDED